MSNRILSVLAGSIVASAAVGELTPASIYETGDMIPQSDIDAFWKARASAHRAGGARTLLSPSRGATYAYRDTFDQYLDICEWADKDPPFRGVIPPFGGTLNPDGSAWQSFGWGGVVNNACAEGGLATLAGGVYRGPLGGPDPAFLRGNMLHVQRASVNDAMIEEGSAVETYETFFDFYLGSPGKPLFFEIDIYKPTHETFQWVRPISYTAGCFVTGILMGGYQSGGLFLPLAQMHGDPNLIEGAVILANVANDPASGEFVINPKQIPEHGWFTLGILFDQPHTMQILVRDSETLADDDMDGSPDWKMPMNTVTGLRMFEEYGYGIEEGWASILPGTLDDPMTTDIEGAGYAVNGDGEVTDRYFYNGNDVASIFSKAAIDALRLYHGHDPSLADVPGYQIQDWWWDDLRIRGVSFPQPENPDYVLPYHDDMERWNVGPLGYQGGRWVESAGVDTDFVDTKNHTLAPGSGDGAPTQSLRIVNYSSLNRFENRVVSNLPTTPRVRGRAGDPAVLSIALLGDATQTPFGIGGREDSFSILFEGTGRDFLREPNNVSMGPVWISGIDVNGLGDGRFYVRQRKALGTDIGGGEFDPLSPAAGLGGDFYTPDQEIGINSPFINVVAAPSGQSELSLAPDVWNVVRMEAEPSGGARGAGSDPHTLRVYVSQNDGAFVELFPDGDDTQRFTTASLAPKDLILETPVVPFVGLESYYVDDVFFDGPTDSDTIVPLASEFNDDSPWQLPFYDSLDTYEKDRPALPQGYADHRLGFMPIQDPDRSPVADDYDEIEFIDGAFSLSNGDPVRIYTIETVDSGSPAFGPGDTVAVHDISVREYNPNVDIYGVVDGGFNDPTEWYILDAVGGTEIARGTWFLANPTGESTFDEFSMIDMGARYSFRQEYRYTGAERESEFVSAAAEGVDDARGSRGDVLKLANAGSVRSYSANINFPLNDIEMLRAFFPLAQTASPKDTAFLTFDVYVAQSTFTTGFFAEVDGGTSSGGKITSLGFGGMGFQSGNAQGGPQPFLPIGNFSVLVPNPNPAPGEPDHVWQDTGVAVPSEQWFTVDIRLNGASEYEISINGTEIASGDALDVDDPQKNTNSLDNVTFLRNQFGESDGLPTPGVVSWAARPPDAAAFAVDYHFFRIDGDISIEAGHVLPQIWPVDEDTGAPDIDMMGLPATRPLAIGDVIAVRNVNPDGGQPLDFPPLGPRFEIVSGARGSLIASGTWINLGLPGQVGRDDPAPAGDLFGGATPPYNSVAPFETVLLGTYENIGATTILPQDVWYVDNFSLESFGPKCLIDLDGVIGVTSGDLAILLAAWGTTEPGANLDGVGVVDSSDLAILLAAWGPCP